MQRKAFTGVWNIIRFNWHFYAVSVPLIIITFYFSGYLNGLLYLVFITGTVIAGLSILISLFVSWYIYDRSNLYSLNWLEGLNLPAAINIANINAGFDETSELLKNKYPQSSLDVFDFYDPLKHTEISIERARRAYPPYPGTVGINTGNPGLKNNFYDLIFLILAVHEIRDNDERVKFFSLLKKSLSPQGRIIVVEHQRDFMNFTAFNIGFFHFYSPAVWKENFNKAGLNIISTTKHTPFLNIFVLSA